MIEEVQEEFNEDYLYYNRNSGQFYEPERVEKKLWYLHHIKKIVLGRVQSGQNDFWIWGTGKVSRSVKEILEIFFPMIKIKGFIDSYKTGEHLGYSIEKPDYLLKNERTIIFVAVTAGQDEIIETLERAGKMCHRDYFILAYRAW